MKELREYLLEAKYYLEDQRRSDDKEVILKYCQENKLDEKFESLLANNEQWRKLAEKRVRLRYFIDEPKKRNEKFGCYLLKSPINSNPKIELLEWDTLLPSNMVAVIKITVI